MLKSVSPLQWIGVIILFNTTLIGGSSQLPDLLLGPVAIKAILAVATLGNGFLGGLVMMFGGPQAMRNTLGNSGDVVFTNRENAGASLNRNVIELTPAVAVQAERAGAAPVVQG